MKKMNKYKRYSSGWFNESHRHSLARQGIKTGRVSYSKSVVDNYDIKGLEIKAEKEAIESRKERVGFSKEKNLEDFGLKNPTKGKQKKLETEKTRQKRLDYQQEVTYSPVTVEFKEKVEEVRSSPILSDEEKREHIQELKHKWREDLKKEVEVGKKIGRGVVKVGKGFFSTVASGLSWDPDKEEKEPDYAKMIRRYVVIKDDKVIGEFVDDKVREDRRNFLKEKYGSSIHIWTDDNLGKVNEKRYDEGKHLIN